MNKKTWKEDNLYMHKLKEKQLTRGGKLMMCPVCGKEMKYCQDVKVEPLKSGGLMAHMFGIHSAEYMKQYECDLCRHVEFEKIDPKKKATK